MSESPHELVDFDDIHEETWKEFKTWHDQQEEALVLAEFRVRAFHLPLYSTTRHVNIGIIFLCIGNSQ